MSRVDHTIPRSYFCKNYNSCVAKSRWGEDKYFFDLFEKLKTLLKNPLRVFKIINVVYTIYVPSLSNQKREQRIGLPKSKCLLRNDFTTESFDCNKENGPKCLNFSNVLIHSQCNLSLLSIHQNKTSTKI